MLFRYFGLNEDPFGVTPEPRYLFESSTHREALASLKYGFYSNRGFTALIAPPGLGKTTLLFCFLAEIRDSARSVFLFDIDSQCEPRELIGAILRDLGMVPAKTGAEMHDQFKAVLVEEARQGRTVAVIIDEAQNLSDAALETVRLLSNFETPSAKLIHIVLAGQPQLAENLNKPSLLQLRQRVTTITHIDPLSAEETKAYIAHRLRMAGYCGEPLFTPDALQRIYEASRGIPRLVNNLCFNAVSICRALNSRQVVASVVEEAIADLQLAPLPSNHVEVPQAKLFSAFSGTMKPKPAARFTRPWAVAAITLLVASLGVLGLAGSGVLHLPEKLGYAKLQALMNAAIVTDAAKAPAPAKADPPPDSRKSDEINPGTAQSGVEPFKVTVEKHQTLKEISEQYLGAFDETRLHQIRVLNPSLVNPDRIVTGQSLWLPGPPPPRLVASAITSNEARNLP